MLRLDIGDMMVKWGLAIHIRHSNITIFNFSNMQPGEILANTKYK